MAWQFYGFMEPTGYHDIYGPLPRKRWIRQRGEKKWKIRYSWRYDASAGSWTNDEYNEDRARKYAHWLAQRDGLTIPAHTKIRCRWSSVESTWRTTRRSYWNGVREVTASFRRIRAVEWGHEVEHYNTRKDGRRGAWTHNEWVVDFSIEIPNWDFEHPPIEQCETQEPEQVCACA